MTIVKKFIFVGMLVAGSLGTSHAIKVNPATSFLSYTAGPNNTTVIYNLDTSGNLVILSTITALGYNATGLATNQCLQTDGVGNFKTTGGACGSSPLSTASFPFGLTASTITVSTITVSGQIVFKDGTVLSSTSSLDSSLSAIQPILYNSATGVFSATQISLSSGVTGNLPAASIAAGSLGPNVISSSVSVNSIYPAAVSAGTYANITLPAANVAAGTLGGSVIASSVAASAAIINQSTPQPGATENISSSTIINLTVTNSTMTNLTMKGQIGMGGNKITNLANGSASTDAVAFGQLPSFTNQGVQTVFTTTGTFTTPANSTTATLYDYIIVGGGGGGGGANGTAAAAGGGGAGAYAEGTFTGVSPNTSITVNVTNVGGVGGSSSGGSGGSTGGNSIGSPVSVTCSAGSGGAGSTAATTGGAAGGIGGTITGSPAISIPGQGGGRGFSFSTIQTQGGFGGSDPLGFGGVGGLTNVAQGAVASTGFGAGGGGPILTTTVGQNGTPGIVIITQETP